MRIAVLNNKNAIPRKYHKKTNVDIINLIKAQNQQDKVNYAVSEREDRVTDLTTLTRMTGCTGMFWAATGLY